MLYEDGQWYKGSKIIADKIEEALNKKRQTKQEDNNKQFTIEEDPIFEKTLIHTSGKTIIEATREAINEFTTSDSPDDPDDPDGFDDFDRQKNDMLSSDIIEINEVIASLKEDNKELTPADLNYIRISEQSFQTITATINALALPRPGIWFKPLTYPAHTRSHNFNFGHFAGTQTLFGDFHQALIIRLTPDLRLKGGLIISNTIESSEVQRLDIHLPRELSPHTMTIAHAGITSSSSIWSKKPKIIDYRYSKFDEGPNPASPLCEDYGNTYRSEVFDISGQNLTGVDPRTGLFNAHYSLATLTGLDGKGPNCDLTLHYSPLRANESGLGDGWAFNFSYYDSRPQLLTLSTGQTLQLTDTDLTKLKTGEILEKNSYQLKATFNAAKTEMQTLDVGHLNGRQEKFTAPSGDLTEHNKDAVSKLIKKLEDAATQIHAYVYSKKPELKPTISDFIPVIFPLIAAVKIAKYNAEFNIWQLHWASRLPELLAQVNRELAYWKRTNYPLLPASIISPTGGKLDFTWEHRQGQLLLTKVKSADTTLLEGDYSSATSTSAGDTLSSVIFKLWPNTDAAQTVTLNLKNYLLKTIDRTDANPLKLTSSVNYGYSPDPTLDRVLNSISESDGSLETALYDNVDFMQFPKGAGWKPPLPRVALHVISPGAGRLPLRTDWKYSGNNYLGYNETSEYDRLKDAAVAQGHTYRYSTTSTDDQGISVERAWNGLHLQVQEQETTPSGASKKTSWSFSNVDRSDPCFGLPNTIETVYQDA